MTGRAKGRGRGRGALSHTIVSGLTKQETDLPSRPETLVGGLQEKVDAFRPPASGAEQAPEPLPPQRPPERQLSAELPEVDFAIHLLDENTVALVVEAVKSDVSTKAMLMKTLDFMFRRIDKDWTKARAVAMCINELTDFNVRDDGETIRHLVLSAIQSQYKNIEALRQTKHHRFLAVCAMLCQSLAQLRLKTGEYIEALAPHAFTVLEMLVKGNVDEEVQCACVLIKDLVTILHKSDKQRFLKLQETIRQVLYANDSLHEDTVMQLVSTIETMITLTHKKSP